MNELIHFYRTPALSGPKTRDVLKKCRTIISENITDISTEICFNIETNGNLIQRDREILSWLLSETFEPDQFGDTSFINGNGAVIEIGPRLNFSTAWSTNAVSICRACGISSVTRIERSIRYQFKHLITADPSDQQLFLETFHDRMTECIYTDTLNSFETGVQPENWYEVPVIEKGRKALEEINREMGLAFDDWDLAYYTDLFKNKIGRNPTNVECFDIGQSNSEHSRHWFFKGRIIIDGKEMDLDLISLVREPLDNNPSNSLIAFKDNSSAVRGTGIQTIIPAQTGSPSSFRLTDREYHIIFTAETHNFPSGVAPFPGAETGTGGRIRDTHATGRGSLAVAGTAAYCVGNLNIPGYDLPWEDSSFLYPGNLASPLEIEIEASNGASDYGNKFGEPVIQGYTRSFGLRIPSGERREWIKPIMFTGGLGQIDNLHINKNKPEKDMLVVKIGGPAYRIGMGGGAASSMLQGENTAELDFNAVQRGDAEMEQKVNRVIRACVEAGQDNPIVSIHDQGAGGNCNVVKEIIEPEGARINIRNIHLGDTTLSVLEIWGAEYQEQDALLIKPEDRSRFSELCARENVPVAYIGNITGDGRIVLYDENDDSVPVDLDLKHILGSMPRKTFSFESSGRKLTPFKIHKNTTAASGLNRVLRLLSVGSKRFLTNKVDRSVTGLIAVQQCAGPLQLTVSDVAVIAQSHFTKRGAATAIGEQPIKGLIDPSAMARMSVGEALTNIVWAPLTKLEDIKCSCNWMWAAKLDGEGADLYKAAQTMSSFMTELGIAVDGGKDSISMAGRVPLRDGSSETVKAPGSMVISAYAPCTDVTGTVTPDIEYPGKSTLVFIDLGSGFNRLGGSALAHAYGRIGDTCPDMEDAGLLKRTFTTIQELLQSGYISAGHDRSDGGLITLLLEMAFSGNCGFEIDLDTIDTEEDDIPLLFSEELGLVIEIVPGNEESVCTSLRNSEIPFATLGKTLARDSIRILRGKKTVMEKPMTELRDIWEATSFRLEHEQANPSCVDSEKNTLKARTGMQFDVTFVPRKTADHVHNSEQKIPVAIIREEGSNGDREMASAFYQAGFDPWDVSMTDLAAGTVSIDTFRGIAFVGGFSYADVLDSAKGWSGVIRCNKDLDEQFRRFYEREDTFSLGVCNGCQLMALLGWVPGGQTNEQSQPRFIHNESGRFESRFLSVKIIKSPSVMLRGMEEAVLGIWTAHGEGRAYFPEKALLKQVIEQDLAPVRYVDDSQEITETYPFNPNGSPQGIAALCYADGRHLAMMPHPERAFLKWQWGWLPPELKQNMQASPWLRMFQNARTWCEKG